MTGNCLVERACRELRDDANHEGTDEIQAQDHFARKMIKGHTR